jgi:hypothetical protein
MNVSATFNGQLIDIVDVSVNGMNVDLVYISSASDLRVTQTCLDIKNPWTVIATSATVN